MNILKIFIFSLLISSATTFAQGYNNRGYGRGINNDTRAKEPTAEEIDKYRNEQIDNYMVELKKELELDELQVIAIKNEILANNKSIDIVLKKVDSDESKSKEIQALREKTDATITSYLNKEQKEKYLVFKANLVNKKKVKKDKKDKKKEDKPVEEQF